MYVIEIIRFSNSRIYGDWPPSANPLWGVTPRRNYGDSPANSESPTLNRNNVALAYVISSDIDQNSPRRSVLERICGFLFLKIKFEKSGPAKSFVYCILDQIEIASENSLLCSFASGHCHAVPASMGTLQLFCVRKIHPLITTRETAPYTIGPCGTTRLHPQGKGGPAGTYCVGADP